MSSTSSSCGWEESTTWVESTAQGGKHGIRTKGGRAAARAWQVRAVVRSACGVEGCRHGVLCCTHEAGVQQGVLRVLWNVP